MSMISMGVIYFGVFFLGILSYYNNTIGNYTSKIFYTINFVIFIMHLLNYFTCTFTFFNNIK